jgi:glyoxylase-like metal-dependent hydrolase (beta-lactamase superfamily II)
MRVKEITVTQNLDRWYETREVEDGIWAIDERGTNTMYLIRGDDKCLLLDTGWGIGILPELVKSLCDLPLIVVNSHGHPDHTFGNGLFSEIHIHPADKHFAQEPPTLETRQWIYDNADIVLSGALPDDFELDRWAITVPSSILDVQDGDVFALGNRMLEVIELPGHSPGSICLLDHMTRSLFVGDSVHSGTIWLQLDDSLPLSQYHHNLQRIQEFADQFDHIFPGHVDLDQLPLPKSILDDLVNGIGKILAGEITGEYEETFVGNGLRCDFGTCAILYNPDRI